MSSKVDRNGLMVSEYYGGRNVAEICREQGIGQRHLYSIIANAPVPEGKQRVKDNSKMRRPLSKVHERIGLKLYEFYFDKMIDRAAAANRLGWSALRLRNVEGGQVDLTLFEMQDIAAFMKIKIGDLLDER